VCHTALTPCSGADVFDRVSMFLETLYRDMQKGTCGQNTLLISHGLFCRLFLTRYYHWTVSVFCWRERSTSYQVPLFCRWRSSTSCGTLRTASMQSWNFNPKDTTNLSQTSSQTHSKSEQEKAWCKHIEQIILPLMDSVHLWEL